ncbi:MAG: hypothetical protein OER21_04755 [Gemmatimonadota bacterium]|nr:hypothetical protein [Gemmatimonadota bacterium]
MKYRSSLRFILEGIEGIGVTLAVLPTWPISRRWLRNWGSRAEERERTWAGDAFVGLDPRASTRAIDVAASCSEVWPWLIQFGLGRAGFYSYELLERVAGIPVRNVESLVPHLQGIAVGDEILLHPTAPGIRVAAVEPLRHLCFGVREPADAPTHTPDPGRSWSMYLEPRSAASCRLLLRACVDPPRKPTFFKRLASLLEEPIDFIMEQRMLRTVKRLAESTTA